MAHKDTDPSTNPQVAPPDKPTPQEQAMRTTAFDSLGIRAATIALETINALRAGKYKVTNGHVEIFIDLSEIDKHFFGDLSKGAATIKITADFEEL